MLPLSGRLLRWTGSLSLVALLSAAGPASADDDPLDAAYAAYTALDLDRASALVEEVLAARPPPAERARALVLRALLAYQRMDAQEGEASLSAALGADPSVTLPHFAPPAVREAFESRRAALSIAPPSPPPRPEPLTTRPLVEPRAAPAAAPPSGRAEGRPRRVITRPSLWTRAWFWSAVGSTGAFLFAGGSYAWALTTKAEVEGSPHHGSEVSALTTRYETARIATVAGAVVGAGLATLSVLLLRSGTTTGPDERREASAATLTW
jgi:hypothetical protein